MSSSRVLTLLGRTPGLRTTSPQGGLTSVRNAGAGPAVEYHPQLPPFPPGPRQLEQARNWVGSMVIFGATAFMGLCYFSDWRVVVNYIPFYNGKFPPEAPPKAK